MAIAALVLGVCGLMAQEDMTQALTVYTDNGEVTFLFRDKPEMTFDGEDALLSTTKGESVRFPMAEIKNIVFGSVNSVKGVAASGVTVSLEGELLAVGGLEPGAQVKVFTAAGAMVAEASAAADGRVELQLGNLASGVYVAAIPGHTFKFIR